MIAAVQSESNALDIMRERLKELDSLKNQVHVRKSNFISLKIKNLRQLSTLTKKLLDADQTNLTLKTNLVKLHEALTEAKRAKSEVWLSNITQFVSSISSPE